MKLSIDKLTLGNFLSFGQMAEPVDLRALNVLIGANGSGKSNLVEGIAFLRETTRDLSQLFRPGGGVQEWIWKGGKPEDGASIQASGYCGLRSSYSHSLKFVPTGPTYEIADESIFLSGSAKLPNQPTFSYINGVPTTRIKGRSTTYSRRSINIAQSVLSDVQDLDIARPLRSLVKRYRDFQFYRARDIDLRSIARRTVDPAASSKSLDPNGANLAAVIGRLINDFDTRRDLDRAMKDFYEDYIELMVPVIGGAMQLFMREKGWKSPTPSQRLSDGTLRWISLLAVLLDPDPASLICIEEPETALHPDVMLALARLLKQASERTQIIVTTHSEPLVDALTRDPDDVIVCEKLDGATTLRRLNQKRLEKWLRDFTLGTLWRRGELGGNRF